MQRQTIFDFYRENKKSLVKTAKSISFSNGVLRLTYPSGFSYELREQDFPNKNLIPCYNIKGEISHYECDTAPLPATNSVIPKVTIEGGMEAWISM